MFSKGFFLWVVKKSGLCYKVFWTLSQTIVLDSSKLKEFAYDKFNFGENGRKFFKQVENTVGRGEVSHYEQFLLF